MNAPIQRALRALSGWLGSIAGPYVDIGTHQPLALDCGDDCAVSTSRALSLPAVARGVQVYSDAVASLPRRIVRRIAGGGVEIDEQSDAAHVLNALSYFDLEGVAASAVMHGNGYARLIRNNRGGVEAFQWIASNRVSPLMDDRGRLYYKVARDHGLAEPEQILAQAACVHVRFRAAGAANRHLGVSPLATCAASLAMAMRSREFQNEVLANVKTPSITLTAPGKISPDLATRLKAEWEQNFGKDRRGRTAVLGEGLAVGTIDISTAVDAELSKQFEFGVAEVARALGIPISLLMQPGATTYGQAIEETRAFAALSLQPFCLRIADELSAKLLTATQRAEGYSIEFDLQRLLVSQSEIADRLSKLVNGGVLTCNEARNQIGAPDVPDGDVLRIPVNTAPIDRWREGLPVTPQAPKNDQTPSDADDAIEESATPLRSVA